MKNYKTIMIKPHDNVAVALESIPKGTVLNVKCQDQTYVVELKSGIEFGHKFAVLSIEQEDDILKYGEVIGRAKTYIEIGEHVHVHNLEGKRGRGDIVVEQQ